MADIFRRIKILFDRDSARKAQEELVHALEQSGEKAGESFVRELHEAFAKRMALLRVQLAEGTISKKEFKKQAELAAKEFNAGIIKGMKEAHAAGKLTDAEFIKLSRTLKRTGDEGATAWDKIRSGINRAGLALGSFFAVSRILSFGKELVRAAEEQRRENLRLEQQLRNVGIAYDSVRGAIDATTKSLRASHRLTQGEVNVILQRLIFLTGNYAESLKNVGLVADVAAARNIDHAAAADLVGKAINGNVTALKKLGIDAKSSAEALDILRQRSEGAAKANTTATEALSKAWQDFKEKFGEALLDATNGRSVFDRLTSAVISLTNHARELMSLLTSLTKALLVVGVVAGVTKLTIAIRGATLAGQGFLAMLRSGLALIGPKGWFILGVAALTAWFERMAGAARAAGEAASAALDEFKQGLTGLDAERLKDEEAVLVTQRRDLERRIQALKAARSSGVGPQGLAVDSGKKQIEEAKRLQTELDGVLARLRAINAERSNRSLTPVPPPSGGGAGAGKVDKKAERDREGLEHDIRVASFMLEEQATREFAEAEVRKLEMIGKAASVAFGTLEEGFKRLQDLNLQLAVAGFDRTLIPQVQRTEHAFQMLPPVMETMAAGMQKVADAAAGNAEQFSTPWLNAMDLIRNEVEGQGTLFIELGQAWAFGGFKGIIELAKHKVKENLAFVIENLAKAFGSFALGNPASATLHLKAAAQHGLAATAWKALSATGGGSSGGASAGGSAGSSSATSASNLERPESQISIYLTGPGWNALNPAVWKVVDQSIQRAREINGPNTKVRIVRGNT